MCNIKTKNEYELLAKHNTNDLMPLYHFAKKSQIFHIISLSKFHKVPTTICVKRSCCIYVNDNLFL